MRWMTMAPVRAVRDAVFFMVRSSWSKLNSFNYPLVESKSIRAIRTGPGGLPEGNPMEAAIHDPVPSVSKTRVFCIRFIAMLTFDR